MPFDDYHFNNKAKNPVTYFIIDGAHWPVSQIGMHTSGQTLKFVCCAPLQNISAGFVGRKKDFYLVPESAACD